MPVGFPLSRPPALNRKHTAGLVVERNGLYRKNVASARAEDIATVSGDFGIRAVEIEVGNIGWYR